MATVAATLSPQPSSAPARRAGAAPARGSSPRETLTAYLLILPSLLLLGLIVFYPIVNTFIDAFYLTDRVGNRVRFVGWDNFRYLFEEPEFTGAVLRTLSWTFWVVGLTILISLVVALAMAAEFPGRRFFRGVLMLPWAISLVLNAIVWRWVLNGQHGMLNELLKLLRVIPENVEWLGRPETAFPIAIGIGVLVSIPFTTTIFLASLQSIPAEIYEAGELDGAVGLQGFRHLTLPHLRPFVTIATVLNVIYVFNSFPIIWTLTQGGPANMTDVIVTYMYKMAFRYTDFGMAAAMAVLSFVILVTFSVLYTLLNRGEEA